MHDLAEESIGVLMLVQILGKRKFKQFEEAWATLSLYYHNSLSTAMFKALQISGGIVFALFKSSISLVKKHGLNMSLH